MKFKPTPSPFCANPARRSNASRAGFTLAEVLAALLFMAIVIPVAIEGLRIASLAGQVGQHKVAAARVAERVLNEMVVTGQASTGGGRGTLRDNGRDYEWSIQSTSWPEDTMQLVTVQVVYQVQGRPYDVQLSTLVSHLAL